MILHLLVLLFSFQTLLGNFTVFTPMLLRDDLDKIPYSIANFGDIPYGKKMTGRLVLADPITACKPITPIPDLDNEKSSKNANFVLISRGNCTFVQKSYQAQLFGAKMAVIYDNIDEVSESIIMVEDGHGDEINIPTIIIQKSIGEKLRNQIENNPDTEVDMVISFDMWKYKQVNYSFWLNIRNRESYQLVRKFAQYASELNKEKVANFEPRYFLDGNFFIGKHNSENCYCDGKYCFMDPDGWGPAHGTDMIDEIIRQICIYQIEPDKWWTYMDQVDQACIKPANMKTCGNNIMNQISINTLSVNQCFENSFANNVNYLLDKEIMQSRGRSIWPGVSVNNMTYRGNLHEKDILEVICESLVGEPEVCIKAMKNQILVEDDGKGLSKTALIVLIVVILFCFFLFLILAYRRWYQKELYSQMDQKVNPMVNQYIAFYETKNKPAKNDI